MSLERLLLHDPRQLMPFNSGTFFLFFTVFVLVYALLPRRRTALLLCVLAFSLYYYYRCNGVLVATLLVTSSVDFALALAIHRSASPRVRRTLLVLSVGLSLSILGYFKYADFLWQNVALLAGVRHEPLSIFLPIGISFYTFQSISYIVDVYRRQLEPTDSLLEYAFFLSFFPQVAAGPIVRASELFPQIRGSPEPTLALTSEGLHRIILGLAKKCILADWLGSYCDLVFDSPVTYAGPEVLLGVHAYALQIYFDFSGYCDIAIGIARVIGIRLPENFDSPYRATSLGAFWQRWHMTLSRWVRDYLFLPLSLRAGRRVFLRYASLVFAMTLVGLWHGAAYNFIWWGALHGAGLAVEAWLARRSWARRWGASRWAALLGWLFTYHFVLISWVLFRTKDVATAGVMFERALIGWEPERVWSVASARLFLIIAVALGGLLSLLPPRHADWLGGRFCRAPALAKAAVFLAVVQAAIEVQRIHVQPFIYFQF